MAEKLEKKTKHQCHLASNDGQQGAFAEDHDGDQPGVHNKKGARSRRTSTRTRARRHSGPNDVEQVAFEQERSRTWKTQYKEK